MLKRACAVGAAALALSAYVQTASAEDDHALYLHNAHTNSTATIIFKRDGVYDPAGLAKLNYFLRDWRENKEIRMDPKLFDLVWEVYRETGATQPITVICGYRSPQTNAMLRRRSNGVAQSSQHIQGKALDFYIPGVDLAKLRAIGLRLQAGGVGFYPTSGSPFVHMDTASVRHWPRMTRSQLVQIFPNGKTLHVPSDGKPLPGYAEALAAYKARQAAGIIGGPTVATAPIAVAVADGVPTPRVAPDREPLAAPTTVAMAETPEIADPTSGTDGLLSYPPKPGQGLDAAGFTDRFAAFDRAEPHSGDARAVAFETAYNAPAPSAPIDLLAAMARRAEPDRTGSVKASLPIKPTAVVATVDVGVDLSRPLRADAITTAVLRGNDNRLEQAVPPVLAYASAATSGPETRDAGGGITAFGVPLPQVSPRVAEAAPAPSPAAATPAPERAARVIYSHLLPADLTLTKLDTQGLRLWIARPSTREKRYALLTMPDFSRTPSLLGKPDVAFAARFGKGFGTNLRTDRFDGAVVLSPAIVDLTNSHIIAAR
jgi:uncharacterized protein YcbK (DUF882 family)